MGPEEEAAPVEPEQEGAPESDTAILPKSFAGGELSPGDTITVKVVRVNEDSVEVEAEAGGQEESPMPMPMEAGMPGSRALRMTTNPQEIAHLASCFSCLSDQQLAAIIAYLAMVYTNNP